MLEETEHENLIGSRRRGNVVSMGMRAGVFLIVIGAILTGVGLNLPAVGWILMFSGGAGLALFFYFWNRRRGRRLDPALS